MSRKRRTYYQRMKVSKNMSRIWGRYTEAERRERIRHMLEGRGIHTINLPGRDVPENGDLFSVKKIERSEKEQLLQGCGGRKGKYKGLYAALSGLSVGDSALVIIKEDINIAGYIKPYFSKFGKIYQQHRVRVGETETNQWVVTREK